MGSGRKTPGVSVLHSSQDWRASDQGRPSIWAINADDWQASTSLCTCGSGHSFVEWPKAVRAQYETIPRVSLTERLSWKYPCWVGASPAGLGSCHAFHWPIQIHHRGLCHFSCRAKLNSYHLIGEVAKIGAPIWYCWHRPCFPLVAPELRILRWVRCFPAKLNRYRM